MTGTSASLTRWNSLQEIHRKTKPNNFLEIFISLLRTILQVYFLHVKTHYLGEYNEGMVYPCLLKEENAWIWSLRRKLCQWSKEARGRRRGSHMLKLLQSHFVSIKEDFWDHSHLKLKPLQKPSAHSFLILLIHPGIFLWKILISIYLDKMHSPVEVDRLDLAYHLKYGEGCERCFSRV